MPKNPKPSSNRVETRPQTLREAAARRVLPHLQGSGRITFKAIPALIDTYLDRVQLAFQALGKPCAGEQIVQLRSALEKHLKEGYEFSAYSWVVVDYQTDEPPLKTLSYRVTTRLVTLEQEFAEWVEVKGEGQLFGSHSDAKVKDVAALLGAPSTTPVLDIGAGTGRNSLALANAGYPVTALEQSAQLLGILRREHDKHAAAVTCIQGDVLDPSVALPAGQRLVVLSEVVSHFFEAVQIRQLLRRLKQATEPGSLVVMNCFLSDPVYTPDKLAREASRAWGCSAFTRKEIAEAMDGLGYELVSDESVHDYEKAHMPAAQWPPTPWFPSWSLGQDIFRLEGTRAPIEMRWLVLRVIQGDG